MNFHVSPEKAQSAGFVVSCKPLKRFRALTTRAETLELQKLCQWPLKHSLCSPLSSALHAFLQASSASLAVGRTKQILYNALTGRTKKHTPASYVSVFG